MESLEDDNFEEFKGGTLEINQDPWRMNCESSPEEISSPEKDNEMNANIDNRTSAWSGSNLIEIPKRITESIWSSKNNNNPNEDAGALSHATTAPITSPSNDNANDYFTFRDGVIEQAVRECAERLVDVEIDGDVLATFLLTEITVWDTEKERLVILTKRTLFSVKYDFIALRHLDHRRVPLDTLDSVVIGELVYPPASLVPRLNGLANGVTNVMRGCLIDRWSQQQQENQNNQQQQHYFNTTAKMFQPRERKCQGVRLLWNGGEPLAFTQRWNPFSSDVPYVTFTSHPLHRLTTAQQETFSVEEFLRQLQDALKALPNTDRCLIQQKDIVLPTYLGLGSLIYNRNALGFFKVRGKFSF